MASSKKLDTIHVYFQLQTQEKDEDVAHTFLPVPPYSSPCLFDAEATTAESMGKVSERIRPRGSRLQLSTP